MLRSLLLNLQQLLIFVAFLCSLYGWGWLLERVISRDRPRGARVHPGLRPLLGISFLVLIGGWLQLFSAITPTVCQLLLGIGVLGTARALTQIPRISLVLPCWSAGTYLLAALLIMRVLFLACVQHNTMWDSIFNEHDDMHGYLAFPLEMLQRGQLGAQPFCQRRMLMLGGESFLQACFLSLAPIETLAGFSRGIASILLLSAFWSLLPRRLGTPTRLMALVAVSWLPWPVVNLSSCIMGAAMLVGLLAIATQGGTGVLIPSLLAGGALTLKNAHLPFALFVGGIAVIRAIDFKVPKRAGRQLVAALIAGFGIAIPWMLNSWQHTGTPFYPLLGEGWSGTAFGTYPDFLEHTTSRWATDALKALIASPGILALLIGAAVFPVVRARPRAIVTLLCLGIVALSVALTLRTAGVARYTWPYLIPAAYLLAAELAKQSKRPWGRHLTWVLPSCMLIMTTPDLIRQFKLDQAALRSPQRHLFEWHRNQLQPLQRRVPAGERILVRHATPFVLDFARNPIWIIDWPGAAALPPGFDPAAETSLLIDYFASHDIHYVLYGYQMEAGFPAAGYRKRVSSLTEHPWWRITAQTTLAFQERLEEFPSRSDVVVSTNGNWLCKLPPCHAQPDGDR